MTAEHTIFTKSLSILFKNLKQLLLCPVCQELVRKPIQCFYCQRPYCFTCVPQQIDNELLSFKCPCGKFDSFKEASFIISSLLDNFFTSCTKCKETVLYSEINKHEENCVIQQISFNQKCPICQVKYAHQSEFYTHNCT